jgi:hypothetical protein
LRSAIDHDADFSREGNQRRKRKIAAQTIADIQALDTLERAREAVSAMQDKWAAKIGLVLKAPADASEAVLHWEVRDRFSSLKDEAARMCFLERFAADPQIASALLTGPAGLTNLSEAERAMLKTKVESHTPAEIIEARSATAKALQEVESRLAASAGCDRPTCWSSEGCDGSWNEPIDATNAAA